MAINIIKPPATTFEMRCNKCDCRFSYEMEDLREDKRFKDSSFNLIVFCPSCNARNAHQFRGKGDKNDG